VAAFRSNFKKESELKAILIDTKKDGREIGAVVVDDDATLQVANSEMEDVTYADRDTVGTDEEWWLILLERKYYFAGGSARFMFDYPLNQLLTETLPGLLGQMTAQLWKEFCDLRINVGSDSSTCRYRRFWPSIIDYLCYNSVTFS
jgi:hypothetical protein